MTITVTHFYHNLDEGGKAGHGQSFCPDLVGETLRRKRNQRFPAVPVQSERWGEKLEHGGQNAAISLIYLNGDVGRSEIHKVQNEIKK